MLRALGIGGVPATGYFGAGWSFGTLLVLYWLETVLVTLVVAVLVLVHRRRTRTAGHWNAEPVVKATRNDRSLLRPGGTTFLASLLGVMVPFTAGHGVFVAVLAYQAFPQQLGPAAGVSFEALADGMTGITILLLLSLIVDLVGIGRRPFRWVQRLAERAQGRMLVTHLTIIFGSGAMAVFEAPLAFFAVFVGLRALVDLGGLLPEGDLEPKVSGVAKIFGRRLPRKGEESFDDHHREEVAAELRKREANEQVVPRRQPRA
jgi:hypothetical protein